MVVMFIILAILFLRKQLWRVIMKLSSATYGKFSTAEANTEQQSIKTWVHIAYDF